MITVRKLHPSLFTEELIKEVFLGVERDVPKDRGRMNLEHISASWRQLCAVDMAETWAAIDDEGHIVGLLGVLYMLDLWDSLPAAMEQFWFVLPEARRTGAGRLLWAEFEQAARKRGCKTMWAGVNVYASPEHLGEFYDRQGFELWGATYRKVIQ